MAMSRGLGEIQRKLLAVLREHDRTAAPQEAAEGIDTVELTSMVYYGAAGHGSLTELKQQSAVRRSLAGLARQGLVFRLGRFRGPRCHWRVPPPDMVLTARRRAKVQRRRA
jgi:hypothetical protein